MPKDRLSGKLVVILHTDIASSTELVQQDKELAHERIQKTFQRFSATIKIYRGHVLELRGDALLAEFERASDAITAALTFQADHTSYLSQLRDGLLPTVRVGITVGEVVIARVQLFEFKNFVFRANWLIVKSQSPSYLYE
jgi:class 3 adenylate cyclase